jgi:hypothetical protein
MESLYFFRKDASRDDSFWCIISTHEKHVLVLKIKNNFWKGVGAKLIEATVLHVIVY